MKKVINYLYGECAETSHLRARCLASADWAVSEAIVEELDFPCKLVIKAQDNGHGLLSGGVMRACDLYIHIGDKLAQASDAASLLQEDSSSRVLSSCEVLFECCC